MLVTFAASASVAQPFVADPAPKDYIEHANRRAVLIPHGELEIDGYRETCKSVPTIVDPGLDDYAVAYPQFIVLNWPLVGRLATPVKLWIYGHECGHVEGIKDEAKADCFGIKRGLRERWLTPAAVDQICELISAGRADSLHFSGADRCALMRHCFKTGDASIR